MEVTKLMNYSYMAANDLAGILVDVDLTRPNQIPEYYLYFFRINSLEKFKKLCSTIDGELWLDILNSKIKIEMPGKRAFTLSMSPNINHCLSDREIKVKVGKYQAIVDILRLMSHRLIEPNDNQHPIESCIQAKELIFIKFSKIEYAKRALAELRRQNYNTSYSRTYTFLCLEYLEDMDVRMKKKETETTNEESQEPQTSTNEEVLALSISKMKLSADSQNKVIQIGSIKMRDLIKNFTIHDEIFFSLTEVQNDQPTVDSDVVVLNEDVEMPE